MAAGCGAIAADWSHEAWSSSLSTGSTELQSPMSQPSVPAGPQDDLPASEWRWAERARVENVLRGTAGSRKGWPQTGWQRRDTQPLDSEEELADVKCRRLMPHAVRWSRHAGEERCALRQQLHAMHRLLEQLQQGLLQPCSVGKNLEEDGHGDEQQRECHLQAHLCMEGARTGQTNQADGVHQIIMSNKEQQELSDALKQELSKAVSRSVDLVFHKISSALAKDSSRLLRGTKRKFEDVCSTREPSLTVDEVTAQPLEHHQDTDKVLIPTEQTEALSLVMPKLCSICHPAKDQQVTKPYQMPPSLYQCGHCVAFGENQLLEHLLRCGVHSNPRSPHCGLVVGDGSPSHSPDIPQHCDKVSSKPSSSMGTPSTLLECPRVPHNKAEDETLQRSPCVSLSAFQHMQCDIRTSTGKTFFQNLELKEGLSPSHLKKAKLMFFYTRYPSSNILKSFFPDVKFTRCVTSQLIKWFSNFREFYYIQMERFARRAVLERDTSAKGLSVSRDSELFRTLNAHYNKANDFQVPDRFLEVAEITLKQFFNSILLAKDTDPSWKKAIYKVICKLDSDIPDYFKSFACS